jgi:transcriptional repressor NrdR
VVDSREADDGQLIRRRRACPECGKRFTTVEEAVLAVVKRSGGHRAVQPHEDHERRSQGLSRAGPCDEDSIALLAQRVEETVRAKGAAEVPSHEVGLAILGPLRSSDQVAYLRFASVYKSFDSLDEFEERSPRCARRRWRGGRRCDSRATRRCGRSPRPKHTQSTDRDAARVVPNNGGAESR